MYMVGATHIPLGYVGQGRPSEGHLVALPIL